MSLDPQLRSLMVARTMRLKTMGFGRDEIRPILATEFEYDVDPELYDELYQSMESRFAEMPELRDLKISLGETWARQDSLLTDLLSLYQVLIQHFNAFMAGQQQLADGSTVRAVKPSDILNLINAITKLGQENVTSKLNALKLIPSLEPPPDMPDTPPIAALNELVDEIEFRRHEDDFEDLDDYEVRR
jgi:hypothetical protein